MRENSAENRLAGCSAPRSGQEQYRMAGCSEQRSGHEQYWFVDSGCSRHMTDEKDNFLSLVATHGGSVAFGNGKSGTIVGIGQIGESLSTP